MRHVAHLPRNSFFCPQSLLPYDPGVYLMVLKVAGFPTKILFLYPSSPSRLGLYLAYHSLLMTPTYVTKPFVHCDLLIFQAFRN